DLLRAAIALIGNSAAVLWTTRGAAAIIGLAGVALWAYSFTIDMAERPVRAPRAPKRLTDRRATAEIEPERFVPESPRKLPMPRAVATPDVRPGPVISERQMTPVTTAKPREKQTSLDFGDK
ncbi:hypothetical protein, partial [Pseudomonas sp. GP01-A4]